MISASAMRRSRPRIGLVLGAGGVLGGAWMTGALAALQDRLSLPLGEADVIVGTSAGSVLAAALRCGLTVDEIVGHQRHGPSGALAILGSPDLGCTALPPWPRPGVGSPRMLLAALLAPHRVPPWVVASAWLPQGRADHTVLHTMVQDLVSLGDQRRELTDVAEWAAGGRTWVVAVDYDSGRRVVFGRRAAPPASLPDAVTASCSVPGWYRPMMIGGRRYVDGGVHSATSAALLARAGLDEVYVLAPMASLVCGPPRTPAERAERLVRRWITFALSREAGVLRSRGIKVTLLTPGPEDLDAMGANLMDPARRQRVFETSMHTSARRMRPSGPSSRHAA